MKTLGQTLKEARKLANLTLREVEVSASISNAYLSQLENDKIKKPSADVLYKLSRAYSVDLGTFLRAAGIIQLHESLNHNIAASDEQTNSFVTRVASYAPTLSESQRNEILNFINFVKSKE